MSNKYKNVAIGLGAVIIGGFAIFTFQANGQTIQISDDGKNPVSIQKVVITKTETKGVVQFEGTLSDIVNETLPRLYKQRDEIQAEITKYEALRDTVTIELNKLPERSVGAE